MSRIVAICILLLPLFGFESGLAQGFINLNFEMANVPNVPTNQIGAFVSVTDGMPGWTAYYLGQPNLIGHNTVSGGGAVVAIEGPSWPSSQILQGNYTAYVIGSTAGPSASAYIEQTGQIPMNSMSIQFYVDQSGFANFQVSFAGNNIPITQIGTGPNYDIMGGNISEYAGQTGLLQFTALPDSGGYLDNIEFLTSPVPEPGAFGFLILGGSVFLGLKRRLKLLP
jgi:hypothetical protein